MTPFQVLSLSVLAYLFGREVVGWWRGWPQPGRRVRALIWLAAAVAIAWPFGTVQLVAEALGVGRGTDLVLYLFGLLFLATSFYFYSRFVRVQRQVTELVRHLAIQEAREGGSGGGEASPQPGERAA
jgi:small membrane protein